MCTHRFPKHEVPENKKELIRKNKTKCTTLVCQLKRRLHHTICQESPQTSHAAFLSKCWLFGLSSDRTRDWCESQTSFKVFICLRKSLALTCCLQVLNNQEKTASSKLTYQALQHDTIKQTRGGRSKSDR